MFPLVVVSSQKKVFEKMVNFCIFHSLGFIFGTKLLHNVFLDTALAFFATSNIFFTNIY
jgi:hypothetical protein